jgi:hypothetical protein
MTQDSNRSAYTQWGEPAAPPAQPAWWSSLATVPALLGHIVIMLAVTSALTIVNLLAGPGVWWSLALLVIWLALVIIHAIGVASFHLLFDEEDEDEPAPAPRARAEPHGPAVPSWLSLPKRDRDRQQPQIPFTWALDDDAPAWPDQPAAETPTPPPPRDEKVPWRAATDIAWLRRPRKPRTDDTDPPASREASS